MEYFPASNIILYLSSSCSKKRIVSLILPIVNFIMWQESMTTIAIAAISALCFRILYNTYWHPLAKFPGSWYAVSFSLSGAIISYLKVEPQWLQSLVKKYGSKLMEMFLEQDSLKRSSQNSNSNITNHATLSHTLSFKGNLLGPKMQSKIRSLWYRSSRSSASFHNSRRRYA